PKARETSSRRSMGAMFSVLGRGLRKRGRRLHQGPDCGATTPYTWSIMLNNIGPAAMVILALNIGLGIAGLWINPRIIERCAFRPWEFARGRRRGTLVASGFAHADVPHRLFNMISFFFFGVPLERIIGTERFVVLYVLGLAL